MKKFILSLILALSFAVNAQHFSSVHVTPHVSSVQVTPHVTPVHVSTVHISEPVHVSTPTHISEPTIVHEAPMVTPVHETPVYNPIKIVPASEIKMYPNGTYYFLLMNNHTHKMDSITGATKEEVTQKLKSISSQEDTPMSNGQVVLIVLGIVALGSFVLFLVKNGNSNNKSWEESAKELDSSESYNKEQ